MTAALFCAGLLMLNGLSNGIRAGILLQRDELGAACVALVFGLVNGTGASLLLLFGGGR